jgi:predicted dehydrogenase
MPQPIKVAVVGLGHMGALHLAKLVECSLVDVSCLCDKNLDVCKDFSGRYSIPFFPDYREIPCSAINAVVIATNTISHLEIAKYFLSHKVNVLLEKPMTDCAQSARELVELARINSCVLQVGHIERFNPAYLRLKSNISSPRYIEAKRITPFRGRGADVNVIFDLMLHDLDLVLDLVNEFPVKVDAVGVPVLTEHIDMAQVRIEFPTSVVANLSVSRVAHSAERTMRVFQPDACLTIDYQAKKYKALRKSIVDGNPMITCHEELLEASDALTSQLESFIDSINNGSKVVVDGYDGLRSIEIVELVVNSINKSNSVLN